MATSWARVHVPAQPQLSALPGYGVSFREAGLKHESRLVEAYRVEGMVKNKIARRPVADARDWGLLWRLHQGRDRYVFINGRPVNAYAVLGETKVAQILGTRIS